MLCSLFVVHSIFERCSGPMDTPPELRTPHADHLLSLDTGMKMSSRIKNLYPEDALQEAFGRLMENFYCSQQV